MYVDDFNDAKELRNKIAMLNGFIEEFKDSEPQGWAYCIDILQPVHDIYKRMALETLNEALKRLEDEFAEL